MLNVSVTNIDKDDDIVDVPVGRYNFNVSVGIFSTNTNTDGQNCLHWILEEVLLSDPLIRNQSMQLAIETLLLIPRTLCSSYKYVCAIVNPGNGSSYTKGISDTSLCFDFSSICPCEGTIFI